MLIKGCIKEKSPLVKLLTLGLLIAFSLSLGSLASTIYLIFFGDPYAFKALSDPETIISTSALRALKILQIQQTIFLFIIPAWIFPYFLGKSSVSYMKANKGFSFNAFLLAIAIVFFSIPIIEYSEYLNRGLSLPNILNGLEKWMKEKETTADALIKLLMKMDNLGDLGINIIMIAVLPAIGEEFLFRGIIQKIFQNLFNNIHLAIIITAVLFSALHLQFYGFLPRMVFGMMFGYFFYYEGSIWLPILAHFINNASIVILSYYFQISNMDFDRFLEDKNTHAPVYLASFLISVLLIVLFIRNSPGQKQVKS